jgi:hypothetical protein
MFENEIVANETSGLRSTYNFKKKYWHISACHTASNATNGTTHIFAYSLFVLLVRQVIS